MQMIIFSLCGILLLSACTDHKVKGRDSTTVPVLALRDTSSNFFPVTSFLKGEILEIKKSGITLQKTLKKGDKTDTSWVKIPEMEGAFAEFLSPVIDTSNLKNIFREEKFMDQTINAFTFSYDRVTAAPDTFAFKRWDVYVDPDNGKVTRVYLIKRPAPDKELQLTWQSGKWYKIVTLHAVSGKTIIEKEEKLSRSYD